MSEKGSISDGYHTFDELYDHRNHLFMALIKSNPELSWRALKHDDGTNYESWFIAGIKLPTGDITYHLPLYLWNTLDGIKEYDLAPKWDGHSPKDVIQRLSAWINPMATGEV